MQGRHRQPVSRLSWRRFEAAAPNEWWQIDAMDWVIATGLIKVFNIVDDHSRLATRSRSDDDIAAIRRRLALYESQTRPALDWIAGLGIVAGPVDRW